MSRFVQRMQRASKQNTSSGGETITHGSQLTIANTGYGAWYDSSLERNLILSDLTVQDGVHWISDFYSGGTSGNPTIVYGYHFTGVILVDVNWITFRGCLFDNPPSELVSGSYHYGVSLDYCTVSPSSPGDYCMGDQAFSANRCYFRGCSDGLRTNGGQTPQEITECYIRVKMASDTDHNDGIQNYAGSGSVYIRRCNISVDPEGGVLNGGVNGGPDAAIMSADTPAGTTFHMEVLDCWLDGGSCAATVRFYDGGNSPNVTYVGSGNRFKRTSASPIHRGAANITPNSQITWANNVWDDTDEIIPLV